jgi:hypothetical protein
MKYREGEIPPELLSKNASNDMLIFTAVIGLLVGVILFYLGRTGNQMWMWAWGAGLVFFSIYLWFSNKYEFKPFEYF